METKQDITAVVLITERCDALFKDLVAATSDRRGNESKVIETYQARFKAWRNTLAISRISRDISETQSLALPLLELIYDNLLRGGCPDALALRKMRVA
jgi:hypothetical protein